MHFLITNDDGVSAPGIWSLADAALAAGHRVTVCAPLTQQSASSHRLTITEPMIASKYPHHGAEVYAIEGTPVDCVRIGRHMAKEPVDFCLSGINNGENVGTGLFYSGTAAAAREAAMLYIPSLAVSIAVGADEEMRANLARKALDLALLLSQRSMPRLTFCNLNAPRLSPDKVKPLRLASISDSYYLDGYEQRINPRGVHYFWLEAGESMEPAQPGTDVSLLSEGHMTCTFVGGYVDHNGAFGDLLQD